MNGKLWNFYRNLAQEWAQETPIHRGAGFVVADTSRVGYRTGLVTKMYFSLIKDRLLEAANN